MPGIIGSTSTSSLVTEQRIVRVPDENLLALEDKETALVQFMLGMKKSENTDSPRLEWFDDDYIDRWATSSALVAADAGSTTLSMTDGSAIIPGDCLLIPQLGTTVPEMVRVSAKPSANVATIVRNVGATGLRTIPSGAAICILGQAFEEGAPTPNSKITQTALRTGKCQIFRKAIDITKTKAKTRTYADNQSERKRLRRKMLQEFKIFKNRQYIWGVPSEDQTGGPTGNPIRTSGGINNYITTNRFDGNGILSQKAMETFSRQAFRYGSERLLLASPMVISAINSWAKSFLQVSSSEKMFGINVTKVQTGHGVWLLARDWSLEDGVSGQAGFGGYAFSLDMDYVCEKVFRPTTVETDNQVKGTDKFVDEVICETGLKVAQEKRHAVLFGVTDYSA